MVDKIVIVIAGGLYAVLVIVALLLAIDGRNPFWWDDWFPD